MKRKLIALFLSVAVSICNYSLVYADDSDIKEVTILYDTNSDQLSYVQSTLSTNNLGQQSIVIFFEYTNKQDYNKTPTTEFFITAAQNGNSLTPSIIFDSELSPYISNQFSLVSQNETIVFCSAFTLFDTSEVELKISDSLTSNNFQTISISLDNIIEADKKATQEVQEQNTNESIDNIDKFIEYYNSSYKNQITDIQDMDIQGLDYRTEYRLNAFKNAVGKKGIIENSNIQIINYGYPNNDCFRIYCDASSYDAVIDICTEIIRMFDANISDSEIIQIFDTLKSVGNSSIVLEDISGYIDTKHTNGKVSGYNLMLDYPSLSFLDK